jgi:hypothetical protein
LVVVVVVVLVVLAFLAADGFFAEAGRAAFGSVAATKEV